MHQVYTIAPSGATSPNKRNGSLRRTPPRNRRTTSEWVRQVKSGPSDCCDGVCHFAPGTNATQWPSSAVIVPSSMWKGPRTRLDDPKAVQNAHMSTVEPIGRATFRHRSCWSVRRRWRTPRSRCWSFWSQTSQPRRAAAGLDRKLVLGKVARRCASTPQEGHGRGFASWIRPSSGAGPT
ncbi:unnamed protein product [Durusdinium trenchii]|uniref:Uncharacterized protein n=1 Tax=Durusdinium trenchii TaxID=1381693 RepID=A0ABP0IPU8_9DINO